MYHSVILLASRLPRQALDRHSSLPHAHPPHKPQSRRRSHNTQHEGQDDTQHEERKEDRDQRLDDEEVEEGVVGRGIGKHGIGVFVEGGFHLRRGMGRCGEGCV